MAYDTMELGPCPAEEACAPRTDPATVTDLDAFSAECEEDDVRDEAQRAHDEYLHYHDDRQEWMRDAVQRQDRG